MSTNVGAGREAEAAACQHLKRRGFAIVAQNWRTRMCEIDIIAQKGGAIYFCEVKYRRTTNEGSGLDYITPKKLQQMRFAAEAWVHLTGWSGEYQLCAIEVAGPAFAVTNMVEDIN
jgi:Holliday junction resolvase-like predicted endonuclease